VSIDGVYQDYEEASDTQHYTIGSRMQVDSRVFYYSKAGGTLSTAVGAFSHNNQHVAFAAIDAISEGDYTIVVTVGAGDGVLTNGNIAEDELVGGYLVIFNAGQAINRRITANTAVTGGGDMTVTMDRPAPTDVADTEHAEMMASPYLNIQTGAHTMHPLMGMAPVVATLLLPYFWLQTWGPVWISADPSVGTGSDNTLAQFRSSGGVDEWTYDSVFTRQMQMAGFVLCQANGGGQGAPFIQLMLAP